MPTTKVDKLEKHKQDLLALRDRLKEDIDSRIESIPEIVFRTGEASSVPTHPADEDTEGLVRELAVGETQATICQAVDEALKRIDQGIYGKCEGCGRKIAEARLDAIPYARYCIECERRHEEEEEQFALEY